MLVLLVFEATVYRHQAHHYRQLQRSPPTIRALFPSTTRDTLDQGLIPCFKYLLNYTFYKFGLEVAGREPGGFLEKEIKKRVKEGKQENCYKVYIEIFFMK